MIYGTVFPGSGCVMKLSSTGGSRPGRWYDPYPRLAFAFRVLSLAPKAVQSGVLDELTDVLSVYGASSETDFSSLGRRNRWYDLTEATSTTVERIKFGSDTLKRLSAETMLQAMERSA